MKWILSSLILLASLTSLYSQCQSATPQQAALTSFTTGFEGFTDGDPTPFGNYTAVPMQHSNSGGLNNSPALLFDLPGAAATDQVVYLVSPCYDVSSLSSPELHVQIKFPPPGDYFFSFRYSGDGGLSWTYPYQGEDFVRYDPPGRDPAWRDVFIDLSNVANSQQFVWEMVLQAAPYYTGQFYVDDIRVGESLCGNGVDADLRSYTTSGTGLTDGSIDLTVSGGTAPYNFLWNNGASTEDVSNLITGWYEAVVTDAIGCYGEAAVFVSEPLNINQTKGGGYPYNYDFEKNGLGLLLQNQDEDTNWKRRRDDTPTPNTGPQPFISFPAGSQFRYLEAGSGNVALTAVLTTKRFLNMSNLTQPTAQIAYQLYGMDAGSFAVEVSGDGGQTWSPKFLERGSQGWLWKTATVDLSNHVANQQTLVRFVGRTSGEGPLSDIAIDQFFLGAASDAPAPQTNPYALPVSEAESKVAASEVLPSENTVFEGGQIEPRHLTAQPFTAAPLPAQTETAGLSSESSTLATTTAGSCSLCVLEDDVFRVSPNPARTGQLITVSATESLFGTFEVFLPGKTLKTVELNGERSFGLELPTDLAPGLLTLFVRAEERTWALKLVVM